MSNVFLELFDLRTDQAEPEIIDETIRNNVRVAGTNLWVLFFAILVASVGLNVNSTAVIIGAMLISPLMGPIVGIGYGLGINDLNLINLSLRNVAVFTFISLVASTLYFTVSPLDTAQPELLSRTSPNMWDVLIAFFGGAAGIIATTRKSISNVVPGVAIATALMPPLCTAGYGIAHGNWIFFGGAFFLYCINSVFIALATLMFVKIFHLPKHHYMDERLEKRTNFFIGLTVILMIIPSVYLAYNLVNKSKFTQSVNQFIGDSYKDSSYVLLGHETHAQKQEVVLTVSGSKNPDAIKTNLEKRLHDQGFQKAEVIIRYSGNPEFDLGTLKTELTQSVYQNMVNQVKELNRENQRLKTKLTQSAQLINEDQKLFEELTAQYPSVQSVTVSRGERFEIPQSSNPAKTTDASTKIVTADVDKAQNSQNNQSSEENADNQAAKDNDQATQTAREVSDQSKLRSSTNTDNALTLLPLIQVQIISKEVITDENQQRIKNWLNVKYTHQTIEVSFSLLKKASENDADAQDTETSSETQTETTTTTSE